MIFLGREYEVLDLGSEGGFDSFLAAPKVGPTGQVGHVRCTFPSLYDAGTLIVDFPNAQDIMMMIRYIF